MKEIKWFFKSVWVTADPGGDKKKSIRHTRVYRRPIPKPHKGKKAVRAAKRAKVAAMKAAGHYKSDHREFIYQ